MAEWPGIELQLRRSHGHTFLYGYVTDPRETEDTPANSAGGIWDVTPFTNLQDGKWHTIAFIWACNDEEGYGMQGPAADSISALQKAILVVDGYIINNQNTIWTGKHDELSFRYNERNDSTFAGIGAYMNSQASATSWSNRFEVVKPSAMKINRMVIWDSALTKNIDSPQLHNPGTWDYWLDSGTDLNSGQPDFDSFMYATKLFGKTGFESYADPITGSKFKVLSANVVAYYKFDEGLTESSTAANDWASISGYSDPVNLTGAGHGKQNKPNTGLPISFIATVFDSGSYLIQDSQIDEDNIFKTGGMFFVDEYDRTQQVGWINYDLGTIVFDGEYAPLGRAVSGLPFLQSVGVSGMSMVYGLSANNFHVTKINFVSQEFLERMMLNIGAYGEEMNLTENPTGLDETTAAQVLDPPAGYVTAIGLYNYQNELIAVAKLNEPIRKDEDHNIITQLKLDF